MTHWFVDYSFEASSFAFWPLPSWFFGAREWGARKKTLNSQVALASLLGWQGASVTKCSQAAIVCLFLLYI